jgi:hypothetical protein
MDDEKKIVDPFDLKFLVSKCQIAAYAHKMPEAIYCEDLSK